MFPNRYTSTLLMHGRHCTGPREAVGSLSIGWYYNSVALLEPDMHPSPLIRVGSPPLHFYFSNPDPWSPAPGPSSKGVAG